MPIAAGDVGRQGPGVYGGYERLGERASGSRSKRRARLSASAKRPLSKKAASHSERPSFRSQSSSLICLSIH